MLICKWHRALARVKETGLRSPAELQKEEARRAQLLERAITLSREMGLTPPAVTPDGEIVLRPVVLALP